jgi:hypothetical protein
MLDIPSSEVVWSVLATHSIRHFPLHFPSRASPCAITFQVDPTSGYRALKGFKIRQKYRNHIVCGEILFWFYFFTSRNVFGDVKKYKLNWAQEYRSCHSRRVARCRINRSWVAREWTSRVRCSGRNSPTFALLQSRERALLSPEEMEYETMNWK